MPISFACACGKKLKVSEEHAGKKSRCPACQVSLTVPQHEAAPTADESPAIETTEDDAYRALNEGPEPEPARRDWQAPSPYAASPSPSQTPAPAKPPARAMKPTVKKKEKSKSYGDPHAPREKKLMVDWGKVVGGVLGVIGGTALLLGGLAFNRFFIWSPIIIIAGLIAIVNGLLTKR